jgi:hypothetical protein
MSRYERFGDELTDDSGLVARELFGTWSGISKDLSNCCSPLAKALNGISGGE